MMRWLIVRVIAWGLRGGIDPNESLRMLRERFPHRDSSWRLDIIASAMARNEQARA